MKCYLAGPLFSEGDRWYLEKIDKICREFGVQTYLPHRDSGLCPSDEDETEYFFQSDYDNIIESDFLIAVLHGQDVDSGTSWEIGCAYALKKMIFSIADDIRIAGIKANINLMIANSTDVSYTYEDLSHKIKCFISNNS